MKELTFFNAFAWGTICSGKELETWPLITITTLFAVERSPDEEVKIWFDVTYKPYARLTWLPPVKGRLLISFWSRVFEVYLLRILSLNWGFPGNPTEPELS